MATVISAPIRTGKTLYSMSIIDKVTKKEPHRRIYTNIVGCSYPGVILIQSTTDRPFDWRDLPNGSILIYDEAHEHPAFSKDDLLKTYEIDDSEYLKEIATLNTDESLRVRDRDALISEAKKKQAMRLLKAKEDILDIGRSLTLHGHFGIDIYFITQKTYKLNDSVKAATNEHLILRRLWKLKACTIYSFAELQEQFGRSTMKNALSWRFWWYPKQLYKFYISAEEHETSSKIPFSFIAWLLLPVLILGYAFLKTTDTRIGQKFFGMDEKPIEQPVLPISDIDSQQTQTLAEQRMIDDKVQECVKSGQLTYMQCKLQYDPVAAQARNAELAASTGNSIEQVVAKYSPSNPFDYSYLENQSSRVFSGCFNNVAYDEQGTIIHDADPNLCKRLMKGDRPYRPRPMESQPIQPTVQQQPVPQVQTQPQQVSLTPEELAKYQLAKEQGLI